MRWMGVLAMAGGGCSFPADPPARFDLTNELLTESRTLIVPSGFGYWEIDFENRRFLGDMTGDPALVHRVLFADGELWFAKQGEPPVQLPLGMATRVGQVFDALRAGVGSFTFVEASPAELDPTWVQRGVTSKPPTQYRVGTPWTWDDDYAVYVDVYDSNVGGTLGRVNIWHIAEARPLKVLGREVRDTMLGVTRATRDVPLDPEGWTPQPREDFWGVVPGMRPWEYPKYHDAVRRLWLEPTQLEPASDNEAHEFAHRCAGAGETTYTWQQEWRVPSSEVPRLAAAQASCEGIRFTAGMMASVTSHPGQQTCVDGTWSVLNFGTIPPTVLTSESVSMCKGNPSHRDGESRPFAFVQDMPMGANLSQLGLRWSGSYRFVCNGAYTTGQSFDVGTARTRFDSGSTLPDSSQPGSPLLAWDCWPGWEPTP